MADKAAPALTSILGSNVAAGDLFVVHDIDEASAEKLKSLQQDELLLLLHTDLDFRVYDNLDPTKEIAFQAFSITAGATRTITMADADVDLALVLSGLQPADINTLAKLNAIVSETLIDTTDSRLSDDRAPTAHAAEHTDGTDDIQLATAAQKGLMSLAYAGKLDGITAGANLYVHPNHSGDVVSAADGAQTIQPGVVSYSNIQNIAANTIMGRITSGSGSPESLSATQLRTIINVEDGADVTDADNVAAALTLTGDITSVGFATSIANGVIDLDHFSTDLVDVAGLSNALYLDRPDVVVTSDGATITLSVEKDGGGDLRILFSTGIYLWDTSPAQTISLTAGSDISPQENYVYFLESTSTFSVSTSGFPSAQHSRVAKVLCQSAASIQTDGPYKVHAWTDHTLNINGEGHIIDINEWIRKQPATWEDGVILTPSITTNGGAEDNVDIATSSGIILQLHDHTYPAFDTSVSSDIYIVNKSGTPYAKITDLNAANEDDSGNAITNGKYINLVIWGAVSEDTGDCKLFINLPSGFYGSAATSTADPNKYSNYSIPSSFTGVGFLIGRLTLKYTNAASGTWALEENLDLKSGGDAGGLGVSGTEFADNVFRIQDEGDVTKELAFQLSLVTTGNVRTITVPDENITLIGTADSRLSDARTPTAHAASHTDGSDDIQSATAAQKGVMTAAAMTKLDGIQALATDDQSGSEISSALFSESNTNNFTDAYQAKLDSIDADHYGQPVQDIVALTALTEASLTDKERRFVEDSGSDYFYDITAVSGDEAPDDQTGGTGFWIQTESTGETAAGIKTKYESNANTNAFDDTAQSKLAGIDANADVTGTTNVDAAGATMNLDTSVSGTSYVLDEDNLISDSNTKLATQQSIKAYVDASVDPGRMGGGADNGATVLNTGVVTHPIVVPYNCDITAVRTLGKKGETGSIVVDLWKDTYANWPPTVGDSITAAAKPTITSATKSVDSTLTGWTISCLKGDLIIMNIDGVTTFTGFTLILETSKT